MSIRSAVAEQAGFDEDMAGEVARYELDRFSPRHKAALVLADAMMTLPNDIDSGFATRLRDLFSVEEILEITLDVMKWSHQKIKVSLGIDEPLQT